MHMAGREMKKEGRQTLTLELRPKLFNFKNNMTLKVSELLCMFNKMVLFKSYC